MLASAGKPRLLITGVTGLLGHTLAPDLIIHTAAMTSVDECERNPGQADRVNVQGTRNVLRALKGGRCSLVHISTDSVFDGEKGHYREEDKTNPVHVYGKTKLAAEQEVAEYRPDALIIRTCIYGWNLVPKPSLAEWVVRSLQEGKSISGFADLFFSPIPTVLLSRLLLTLARENLYGILHVTGGEGCSKFDFARRCALEFDLDPQKILPVASASAKQTVRRPADVTLAVDKAARLLGRPLPSIEDGLRAFHSSEPLLS